MRIAFVTNPALGHVLPLLPLALAARDAGHDVVVVGGASIGPAVERVGLPHTSSPVRRTCRRVFAQVPERAGLTGRRRAAVVVATACSPGSLPRRWPRRRSSSPATGRRTS